MLEGLYTAICFIIGSGLSALAGYIGMLIATQANSRTCEACRTSISRGLEVSFASGAVMGNAVVGLGLLGLSVLYVIFTYASADSMKVQATNVDPTHTLYTWNKFSGVFNRLAGFGFGASTIGMFARVGGGVFTKAADVGSDLGALRSSPPVPVQPLATLRALYHSIAPPFPPPPQSARWSRASPRTTRATRP